MHDETTLKNLYKYFSNVDWMQVAFFHIHNILFSKMDTLPKICSQTAAHVDGQIVPEPFLNEGKLRIIDVKHDLRTVKCTICKLQAENFVTANSYCE